MRLNDREGLSDLLRSAKDLVDATSGTDNLAVRTTMRRYIEQVTFASAEELLSMLNTMLSDDWMALPPWARNLAYRLACLQRPGDVALLREASSDLFAFGPDWDKYAEELERKANSLEEEE